MTTTASAGPRSGRSNRPFGALHQAAGTGRQTSVHEPGRPSPADMPGDILAETWRPGSAEPVAIHVRPELYARLSGPGRSALLSVGRPAVVIDDQIPTTPGYEIHRKPPAARGHRTTAARPG
jgi:hypothetical protein